MKKSLAAIALLSIIAPALSQTAPPMNPEFVRRFASTYNLIKSDYVTEPNDEKLFASCISGMVGSLDKQSLYLDESTLRLGPNLAGIGLDVQRKSGLPFVITVTEGSPAARAGLRPRDYLLAIDGDTTEEMDLATAMKRLQGVAGSEVKIVARHYGDIEERAMTLTREHMNRNTVHSRLVGGNVAYLRISTFGENTPEEFVATYHSLKKNSQGKLRGMILDLRGSNGGTVPPIMEISSMFFQAHVEIMSTHGRRADANQKIFADQKRPGTLSHQAVAWPPELSKLPLVVLVDTSTASGSEILAGAIKDHKRGKILGQKTMGIGTIQTMRMIDSKAGISFTTARYTTPSGLAIDGNGIEPDIPMPKDSQEDEAWISKALGLLQ